MMMYMCNGDLCRFTDAVQVNGAPPDADASGAPGALHGGKNNYRIFALTLINFTCCPLDHIHTCNYIHIYTCTCTVMHSLCLNQILIL